MTNPLRHAADALQQQMAATTDPGLKRSLQLALGSAIAAESKFYPGRKTRLRVVLDSVGLPVSSTDSAKLTQAIGDSAAMMAAYRASGGADSLPNQMHGSYRSRYSLVALGSSGNVINFGFREFGVDDEPGLVDVSMIETITEAAVRDLVELLPLTASDDAALDSVLSLPVTQRVGINYLVDAVRETALGVTLELADEHGQLSTAQAAVLGNALTEQRTDTRTITMEGILDGLRTRRRIFYLDADRAYQGSVDEEILPLLPRFMGQIVEVTMQESVVRHASGRSGRPTYRLTNIDGENPLW